MPVMPVLVVLAEILYNPFNQSELFIDKCRILIGQKVNARGRLLGSTGPALGRQTQTTSTTKMKL